MGSLLIELRSPELGERNSHNGKVYHIGKFIAIMMTKGTPFCGKADRSRDMPVDPQSMTRLELYSRVWQTPPDSLASELSLEPHALRELCKAHQIPWPSAGYWRRKAAQLPAQKKPLNRINGRLSYVLAMGPTPTAGSGPISAHGSRSESSPPENSCETQSSEDMRRRAMVELLFAEAKALGMATSIGKLNIINFSKSTATIRCRLRDKLTAARSPLPPEVKRHLPEHLRHRNLVPTGRLAFEIDPHCIASGKKRQWIEKPSHPFETLVSEILDAVRAALDDRLQDQRLTERRRDVERSARRAHWDELAKNEQDERRWAILAEVCRQRLELERIEQLLLTMEQTNTDPSSVFGDRTAGEWLDWIRDQLNKRGCWHTTAEDILRRLSDVR